MTFPPTWHIVTKNFSFDELAYSDGEKCDIQKFPTSTNSEATQSNFRCQIGPWCTLELASNKMVKVAFATLLSALYFQPCVSRNVMMFTMFF